MTNATAPAVPSTDAPVRKRSGGRDRYIDAIRAFALLIVVLGHWFATALVVAPDGTLQQTDHLLRTWEGAAWATWILQVVPLFVFVSAAVNGPSLQRTWDEGGSFADWYRTRLRRLILPAAAYLTTWLAIAGGIRAGAAIGINGFDGAWRVLGFFSGSLTVHLWFLGMLVATQLLLPVAQVLDRRYGWRAPLVMVVAAVLVDVVRFTIGGGAGIWGTPNALLVWLVPQQLGLLWGRGKLNLPTALGFLTVGLATLVAGVEVFGYGVSLVGGDLAKNNVLPPTVMLGGLALAQAGAIVLLARPARAVLRSDVVWGAVQVLGAVGMPLYLWHKSFEPMVAASLSSLNRVDLIDGVVPSSPGFWSGRLAWVALLLLVTVPFAVWQLQRARAAARARRDGPPPQEARDMRSNRPVATGRVVVASGLTVGAIALAMLGGVTDFVRLGAAVGGLMFALTLTSTTRHRAETSR